MITFVCLSLAPFIYASDNGIHYVGDLVTVMCTGFHEFSAVHWIQTNTQYEHFQSDIEINTVRTISYIFINNITHDYNNTAIRCEGSYTNGQSFSSAVATILLQGRSNNMNNIMLSCSSLLYSITASSSIYIMCNNYYIFFQDLLATPMYYTIKSIKIMHNYVGNFLITGISNFFTRCPRLLQEFHVSTSHNCSS